MWKWVSFVACLIVASCVSTAASDQEKFLSRLQAEVSFVDNAPVKLEDRSSVSSLDPVLEFIMGYRKDGRDPKSDAVRQEAERFRTPEGLLPDLLIAECYPKFRSIQLLADTDQGGEYTGDAVWPQPLRWRQKSRARLILNGRAIVKFGVGLEQAPVVDMTGSEYCLLRGLLIDISTSWPKPACSVFWGREVYEDNANCNALEAVQAVGPWGLNSEYGGAALVNVGCEVYRVDGECNFRFSGPKGYAYYTSSYNELHITSPYGAIAGGFVPGRGGAQSNAGGVICGSSHFGVDNIVNKTGERAVFKFGSRTHSVWVHDVYVTSKSKGMCDATFVLGDLGDNNELYSGVSNVVISNIHDEAYASEFFLLVNGKTRGVVVRDLGFVQAGQLLGYADVNCSRYLDGIRVEGVYPRPHPEYWTGHPQPTP